MSDALPGTAAADDRMAGTPAYLAPEQHAGADAFGGERLVRRRRHAVRSVDRTPAVRRVLARAALAQAPQRPASTRVRSSRRFPTISTRSVMGLLCRDPERRLSGRDALDKLVDRGTRAPGDPSRASRAGRSHLCRPRAAAGHPERVVRRGQRGPCGGRLHSRPLGHRQDRAGPAVPRSAAARRRCGGASRPLLPARVGAVRGARRDHRQSECRTCARSRRRRRRRSSRRRPAPWRARFP